MLYWVQPQFLCLLLPLDATCCFCCIPPLYFCVSSHAGVTCGHAGGPPEAPAAASDFFEPPADCLVPRRADFPKDQTRQKGFSGSAGEASNFSAYSLINSLLRVWDLPVFFR